MLEGRQKLSSLVVSADGPHLALAPPAPSARPALLNLPPAAAASRTRHSALTLPRTATRACACTAQPPSCRRMQCREPMQAGTAVSHTIAGLKGGSSSSSNGGPGSSQPRPQPAAPFTCRQQVRRAGSQSEDLVPLNQLKPALYRAQRGVVPPPAACAIGRRAGCLQCTVGASSKETASSAAAKAASRASRPSHAPISLASCAAPQSPAPCPLCWQRLPRRAWSRPPPRWWCSWPQRRPPAPCPPHRAPPPPPAPPPR